MEFMQCAELPFSLQSDRGAGVFAAVSPTKCLWWSAMAMFA